MLTGSHVHTAPKMSVIESISLNGIARGLSRSRDSPLQHTLVLMYCVAQEGHHVTEKG